MPKISKHKNGNSWNVFDFWQLQKKQQTNNLRWKAFDDLQPYYEIIIENQFNELLPLVYKWNKILYKLGKDPTNHNWEKFRPLRLSREEDWSDWFAHLIETSTTGIFAKNLFEISTFELKNYIKPSNITREEIYINFRADVIIEWNNANYSHVEIKVGDKNLLKTFETSELFMQKYNVLSKKWTNYILLLSNQLPEWEQIIKNQNSKIIIHSLTWEKVCVALRRALRSEETTVWKVWAYTFIGAIEQILIGFKLTCFNLF